MATKFIELEGKIAWARWLFQPDDFNGAKRYIVNFFPTSDALTKLRATGVKLKEYTNDKAFPGEIYVRPRRDVNKLILGDLVEFGPPEVTFPDGSDTEALIGNGSKVTMTISVFDAGRFKGHRLEKVKITELITYDRPNTESQEEEAKSEPSVSKKPKMPF